MKKERPKTLKIKVCDTWIEIRNSFPVMIRAKCTDCCCGIRKEVANCTSIDCPLYFKKGYLQWEKYKINKI